MKELVEDLQIANDNLYSANQMLEKEIERLNNIINEAIEYIEEKYDYILGDDTFLDHDERIERKQIDHILGILNKGSDEISN